MTTTFRNPAQARHKWMRGRVHAAAIILGIGAPTLLTVGTLRKGPEFEVVATPRQVIDAFEKDIAGSGIADAAGRYVSPEVQTYRGAAEQGRDAFATTFREAAVLPQGYAESARKVSGAGNLVIVQTTYSRAGSADRSRVDIYRVYDGRVVEYWAAAPKA